MTVDHSSDPFGYDMRILHKRITTAKNEILFLENFYSELYRNCYYINVSVSKWGMFEQARKIIFESRKVRQQFSISLKDKKPVDISKLNLPK
jgi:hypothetical protein